VTGSFVVENIGGSDSFLHWRVNVSGLEWGTWSFVPESGENLTPQDGKITIQVTVQAPLESSTKFEGFIVVENCDDPADFDIIPVTLKTPVGSSPFQLMLQWLVHKVKDFFFIFHQMIDLS
jgi:hypothetical protein